jgi:hypothetical protein
MHSPPSDPVARQELIHKIESRIDEHADVLTNAACTGRSAERSMRLLAALCRMRALIEDGEAQETRARVA